MRLLSPLTALSLIAATTLVAEAQSNAAGSGSIKPTLVSAAAQHVLLGGIGNSRQSDPNADRSTPWSFGYLYRGANSPVFWGVDIAGEGTSINNTSGYSDEPEQGFSFNLLAGRSVALGQTGRLGLGAVLGFRRVGSSCPDSYLGYECYADEPPDVDYDLNAGVTAHLIFRKLFAGARVTSESEQYLIGIVF